MEGLRKRENLGAQESRFEVDDCGRVIGHFSRQVCASVMKVRSRDVTLSRETRGEGVWHVTEVERLTWSIGALMFTISRYIYMDLRGSVIYYYCNRL